MKGKALLEALTEAAKTRGVAVRKEPMSRGTSGGGLCVLKGVPTVFVDDRASVDAQIEVLAAALRRWDWSDAEVDPAVKSVLGRPRAKKDRAATSAASASGAGGPPTSGEGRG